MNVSFLCVTFKDDTLVKNLIRSVEKNKPKEWNIDYVVVENTLDNSYKESVLSACERINYLNVPFGEKYNIQKGRSSLGHGLAYEEGKKEVKKEWTFVCHSDCFITSPEFFTEFQRKAEEGYDLIGVCYDKHPDRIDAVHCSGYLVRSEILKEVSMLPDLPKIDTTDMVTVHARNEGKKIFVFKNTYNDPSLNDIIDEPYKSLGPNCGIDRCISETSNKVIYMHQGRGTSKLRGEYSNPAKISTSQWFELCNKVFSK